MMRRLRVVPFDRTFKERETDRDLFQDNHERTLWGVEPRAAGLETPSAARTFLLLIHANPLKGFIDERCLVEAGSKVTLQAFYEAYREWAKDSGYTLAQVKSTVRRNIDPVKRHAADVTIIGIKLR